MDYEPNTKKLSTALALAFIFGDLGAHNFYLKKSRLGIIHLCIFLTGSIIMVLTQFLAQENQLIYFAGQALIILNRFWIFGEIIQLIAMGKEKFQNKYNGLTQTNFQILTPHEKRKKYASLAISFILLLAAYVYLLIIAIYAISNKNSLDSLFWLGFCLSFLVIRAPIYIISLIISSKILTKIGQGTIFKIAQILTIISALSIILPIAIFLSCQFFFIFQYLQ